MISLLLVLGTAPPTAAAPGSRTTAAPEDGFVQRSGRVLVDGDGQAIRLNGVNLGQWLLWEQWQMGAYWSGTTETGLFDNLASLVGERRATQFREALRDHYVTSADFRSIASLGFNVVRVPFNHTLLEDDSAPGVYKQSGWERLDTVLEWAEQEDLYVVLDLHATPCGQNPYFPADPDPTLVWDSPLCQERTVALWTAIADRYADRTVVAGYDLLSEPESADRVAFVDLYRRIIAGVRSVDRNHLVFVQGAVFASEFSMFDSPLDSKQVYSFHQYLWGTPDPAGDVRKAKVVAERDELPLWVGEFGVDGAANVARQVGRFNADPDISGWAYWTWKLTDNLLGPALNAVAVSPQWSRLVNWMNLPDSYPKPTVAEAHAGMDSYVSSVQLANTRRNPFVASALAPWSSTVRSAVDDGKCLDARSGSDASGTVVQVYDCNGSAGQVWSRGASTRTAIMTKGKCLDVAWGVSANGSRVQLWDCNGTAGQQWTIDPGDRTIRALGRCLDVPWGSASNFNQLQLWDCNGSSAQRWTLR